MIKKATLPFFVLLVLSGFFIKSTQAFLPLTIDEVIIMVPEAESGRNDKAIKIALESLPGVVVVDYCNSQKCFYMQVDRSQQPDDKNIINTILEMNFHIQFKLESTIQQAQSNCADRN